VLGDHVHQAGSLVAPDRLRFDFTHHGPVTATQLAAIEAHANAGVWAAAPVQTREEAYADAVASGAMALFGEKYGDVVRVVDIPDWSVELCGGTHVRNTAEIGCIRVVAESGVAAGVRRLEAVTGPRAFQFLTDRERALQQLPRGVLLAVLSGLRPRCASSLPRGARRVLSAEIRRGPMDSAAPMAPGRWGAAALVWGPPPARAGGGLAPL
jgi:alanyl-tRNA synthetase